MLQVAFPRAIRTLQHTKNELITERALQIIEYEGAMPPGIAGTPG
jgi:hypothetical protein